MNSSSGTFPRYRIILPLLFICLACMAVHAGAVASQTRSIPVVAPATTTPTPAPVLVQRELVTAVTTPLTVSCTAPCECLEESLAIAKWGVTGYLRCAELPCSYQYSAVNQPVQKFCFRPNAVTVSDVQVNQAVLVTTETPAPRQLIPIPLATTEIPKVNKDIKLVDTDGDGIIDVLDNCAFVYNPEQWNWDGDQYGSACDNCVWIVNDDQLDSDGDCSGLIGNPKFQNSRNAWITDPRCGDSCDNCPATWNPTQVNNDADPYGNACDTCWEKKDTSQLDSDGDCATLIANGQFREKGAWVEDPRCGDNCDNCPAIWNPDRKDSNNDGKGDACDCNDMVKGPYEEGVDCGWASYLGHIGTPEGTGCPKQRCSPCPYDSEPLPAEFSWTSWRGINWMTPVKDQGSCGSCWAFATVGGVEAAYTIEKEYATDLNRPDLSEQWLVSGHPGMGGSCSGGHTSGALADVQANGITKEIYFPYKSAICGGFGGACNASCTGSADPVWGLTSSCARPFARTGTSSTLYNSIKIAGFTPVESGEIADVKRAIMCHGPPVTTGSLIPVIPIAILSRLPNRKRGFLFSRAAG